MEIGNYVEWTYENFSSWDAKLHGNCLSHKYSPFDFYPRGPDGNGDNLVVKVYDSEKSSRVEVSFIGPDGSVIRKQEVNDPKWKGDHLTLPPGPKFEEVVRTVQNNNKDVVTLRLYRSGNSRTNCGRTTIEVSEECLKIPPLLLRSMELTNPLWIACLSVEKSGQLYNLDLNACLVGSTLEDARISVLMLGDFAMEHALCHARISLLDCRNVVENSAEGRSLYCGDKKTWTLPTAFRLKEVIDNGFCLTVCVKFVFKDLRTVYSHPSIKRIEPSSVRANIPSEGAGNLTNVVVLSSNGSTVTDAQSQELKSLY